MNLKNNIIKKIHHKGYIITLFKDKDVWWYKGFTRKKAVDKEHAIMQINQFKERCK